MYWDQFQNVPVCGSENEASDQEKKSYLIYENEASIHSVYLGMVLKWPKFSINSFMDPFQDYFAMKLARRPALTINLSFC